MHIQEQRISKPAIPYTVIYDIIPEIDAIGSLSSSSSSSSSASAVFWPGSGGAPPNWTKSLSDFLWDKIFKRKL